MKLLLIMPEFYDISGEIKKGLEKYYDVTFVNSSIKMNPFEKFLNKISKKYIKWKFNNYINRNLFKKCSKISFEKIVIIYAGSFYWEAHIIEKIRKTFPSSELIYYAWDSMKNVVHGKEFLKFFDRKLSYDFHDSKDFNMKFLPLFYFFFYPKSEIKYDCVTIFTFYMNKEKNYIKIMNSLNKQIRNYSYVLLHSRISFIYKKIFQKDIMGKYKMKDFKYKKIDGEKCVQRLSEGKCIVDVPMEGNNGLSSRIINALHNEKKIITTNPDIKKYIFYCENNIFVVSDTNAKIPNTFFETKFDSNFKLDKNFNIDCFCSVLCGALDIDYTSYYLHSK